ncbi:MAG: short-chain dehydrogenase [Rhodospirillaceae bacterium]|nr:short-chain dehydrogenase [Rhodospirillaceae bacterium]|tara:strand:- start:6615 stop:7364 length:750 start_codon:yes stop_codon:yes gene_type:complete
MSFEGKRIVVTGSTRGIGLATARLFVEQGAEVVVHGRSEASVNAALAEIGGGHGVAAELDTLEGCKTLIDRSLELLSGLDVLVNNAALGDASEFGSTTPEFWQTMMDVNVRAPFFLTQEALPALRDSGGNVVMVSSVSGLMGHPDGVSVYCTSKGALINMTKVLALELAGQVRVNCLAPGPIDTDMHRIPARETGDEAGYFTDISGWVPMGRIGTAGEMAQGILYLASDAASFTTGAILSLDGGSGAGH